MQPSRVPPPQSETRARNWAQDRTARRCRSLALEFLGAAPSWTKLDLASWLLEYGRLAWADADQKSPALSAATPIRHEALREMILRAHERVMDVLEGANGPDVGSPIIVHAFVSDLVVDRPTEDGQIAWAPFSRPGMSLADRVLSLLAADCLMSRDDYAKGLSVCHDCGCVSLACEQGQNPSCGACSWDAERVSQVSIRECVPTESGFIETMRAPTRTAV